MSRKSREDHRTADDDDDEDDDDEVTNENDGDVDDDDQYSQSRFKLGDHDVDDSMEDVKSNGVSEVELDIAFFRSLASIRPIGIHKHFRMIALQKSVLDMTGVTIPFEELWERMEDLYDLDELDDMFDESIPFPSPRSLSPLLRTTPHRPPNPSTSPSPTSVLKRDRKSSHQPKGVAQPPSLSPAPTTQNGRSNGKIKIEDDGTTKFAIEKIQKGRGTKPRHSIEGESSPTHSSKRSLQPRLSGGSRFPTPSSLPINPKASSSLPSGSRSADLINSPYWEREFGLPVGFGGGIGRGSLLQVEVEVEVEEGKEGDGVWFDEVYERAGGGKRAGRVKVEDERDLEGSRMVADGSNDVRNGVVDPSEVDRSTSRIGVSRRIIEGEPDGNLNQIRLGKEIGGRGRKRNRSIALEDHQETFSNTTQAKKDVFRSTEESSTGRKSNLGGAKRRPSSIHQHDQNSEDELDALSRRSDSTPRGSSRGGAGVEGGGGNGTRSISSKGRSSSRGMRTPEDRIKGGTKRDGKAKSKGIHEGPGDDGLGTLDEAVEDGNDHLMITKKRGMASTSRRQREDGDAGETEQMKKRRK